MELFKNDIIADTCNYLKRVETYLTQIHIYQIADNSLNFIQIKNHFATNCNHWKPTALYTSQ